MTNLIPSILETWRAARSIAAMDVARLLAREAFKADERVVGIRFDFDDCGGVPFIWLEFLDGALSGPHEGDTNILISDYEGHEAFPQEELEAVSYDLLRWEGKSGEITFARAEVMTEPAP